MTSSAHPRATSRPRSDGWTTQRRGQFIEALGAGIDVRRACALVGLSRQAAYRLRTRDAGFARAWADARRAAFAAEEQRFRALAAERLPWLRADV